MITVVGLSSCAAQSDQSALKDNQTIGQQGGSHDSAPEVRRGDFSAKFVLGATSESSSRILVTWPEGLAINPAVANLSRVSKGIKLGELVQIHRKEIKPEEEERLKLWQGSLSSPVDGVVNFDKNSLTIKSEGLNLQVSLTPIQYLRIRAIPFSGVGTIDTVYGKKSFPCSALWQEGSASSSSVGQSALFQGVKTELINSRGGGSSGEPSSPGSNGENKNGGGIKNNDPGISPGTPPGTGDGEPSARKLLCRLPSNIESAAGLPGSLTVTSTVVKDVLMAPTSALGRDEKNGYYVVKIDEPNRRIPVELGPTDGVRQVIKGPLRAGIKLISQNND
ncbi:hypothetical protein [Austwickia sp. TVS 96-490-7B]|uniref:hypothetical protein n=1 Tax=Austwickia sp. TVS 96-490-7B TaxID=2830843 RepID=UPI001C565B20|nr:hypothetical protein [Austwickia sp. TVS 96-490-7B]